MARVNETKTYMVSPYSGSQENKICGIIHNHEYSVENPAFCRKDQNTNMSTNKRISRQTIRQDAMISRLPTDLSCISVKLLKPPRLPEPLTHSQVFDVREESEGKVKRGYKMVCGCM